MKTGDIVYVEYNNYTYSTIHINKIKRTTKTLIILQDDSRYKKVNSSTHYLQAIGTRECHGIGPNDYIYSQENEYIRDKHINQCLSDIITMRQNKLQEYIKKITNYKILGDILKSIEVYLKV